MLTDIDRKEMRQIINTNRYEIFILSLDEMDRVVDAGTRSNHIKEKWKKFKKKVEFSANYYATGGDIFLLTKLISESSSPNQATHPPSIPATTPD